MPALETGLADDRITLRLLPAETMLPLETGLADLFLPLLFDIVKSEQDHITVISFAT